MENIVRSVYLQYLQTCLLTGRTPTFPQYTTLNEKLAINSGVLPAPTDDTNLKAYVIGNKGHQGVAGAEGIFKTEPVPHRATDSSLYGQIPFVLVPVTSDISQIARAKYCLRREEVWDGIRYAAYYGRRIDFTNTVPQMQLKTVTNGVESTTPFVPSSSNLNPTAPDITSTGVNTVDGSYVAAVAALTLVLTEDDATQLLNVAKVIYGDQDLAIISEIGLVTGTDKVVQVTSSAGNFNMNELIVAQIGAYVPAMIPLVFNNTGTTIALNVGATEPTLTLTSTGT
jgi:hypothetical protein